MKIKRYCYYYFEYTTLSLHVLFYFLWNLPILLRINRPLITIFGSAKMDEKNYYAQQASKLASLLVQHNFAILTGGGPGIMQAASSGAFKTENNCLLGIGVDNVDKDFKTEGAMIRFPYFFMRNLFLTKFSIGIIVFPGGMGTLNELFKTLNDRKHNLLPDIPVVLFDSNYWQPLRDWLNNYALKQGLIDERLANLYVIVDTIDEACNIMLTAQKNN